MSQSFQSTATNTIYVRESPKTMLPWDKKPFTLTLDGTGTLASDATLWTKIYKDATDMSATLLSGSTTKTGLVITTPIVQNLVGGIVYTLYIHFSRDGVEDTKACKIFCQKAGF